MSRDIEAARRSLLGAGFALDNKRRNAWAEYGYKDVLTDSDFFRAYSRHGIAQGAVNKLHDKCWGTDPWLIEGEKQDEVREETAWERQAKAALPDDFWYQVAEADKRRLIGRYAGLVLLLRDNAKLSDPVTRASAVLEEVVPVWGSALRVTSTGPDGKPTMYSYTDSNNVQSDVHPDRVVVFGDMASDAIGFLEAGYNNVVNLEKIEGGSGESFLKNSSRQIHINFDKEVNIQQLAQLVGADGPEGIQDKLNEVNHGLAMGIDKTLATQGATASALVANVPDPKPHYEININTAAAAWDIPVKILVGNQTGERASTEDQKYWADRCQQRRVRVLSREIKALVRRLQAVGVLPDLQQVTVMWDDLRVPTVSERLANAKMMSDINAAAIATGTPVFSDDEIRSAAGYEAKADAAGSLPEGED